MAINLIRNSRVFFTTNVDPVTGVVNSTGFNVQNTFEIQVLDGFSFTQNTNAETITLNEAGATPNRGQRSFNTSLAPVEWSFSTYARPSKRGQSTVSAEEKWLWTALTSYIGSMSYLGSQNGPNYPTTGSGQSWKETTAKATLELYNSQYHQMLKFGLIIQADNATYAIDDACMNQVSIDFGIDQITTLAWSGMGKALRRPTTAMTLADVAGFRGSFSAASPHVGMTGGFSGSALAKDINAAFIANKLSTAYVGSGFWDGNGYIGSNRNWAVPITGGNITINNNITYLTPAVLGTVNEPVTYFTGTRAISGTLSAYLKSGTTATTGVPGDTADLMSDILSYKSSPDNKYAAQIDLGGVSNANRVTLKIPHATLQVPTVKSESVLGVDINFTGQAGYQGTASNPLAFDIERTNEFVLEYYSAATL